MCESVYPKDGHDLEWHSYHWRNTKCSLKQTLTTHEIQLEKCCKTGSLEEMAEEMRILSVIVARDGGWRGSKGYIPMGAVLKEAA